METPHTLAIQASAHASPSEALPLKEGARSMTLYLSAPFLSYLAWMLAAIIICAVAAVLIAKLGD